MHVHYVHALEALIGLLQYATGEVVIKLVGPPGTGKSTVLKATAIAYENAYRELMIEDPGLIPVLLVELAPAETGHFNWRGGLYLDALKQLNDPLTEHKANIPELRRRGVPLLSPVRQVNERLRTSMQQAIEDRGVAAVLLDDAHVITRVGSRRVLLSQVCTVASLASKSNRPHVLGGTYPLLDLSDPDGTLPRREKVVHIPSYDPEKEGHVLEFKRIIVKLIESFPTDVASDVRSAPEYLMYWSAGSPGVLKEWFLAAAKLVLSTDRTCLTLDDMRSTALAEKPVIDMLLSARAGEARCTPSEDGLAAIKGALRERAPGGSLPSPWDPARSNNSLGPTAAGELPY
jgi:energy-coupling factor transporter ATP-binding protein EcfA2